MRKYIFLIILLVPITSTITAQKNVYFDKLENINDLYYHNGKLFTGFSLVRHDSTLKKKIEIQWKDGLMDGTKTTWYKDEKLKETMIFRKGKRHGEYVNYYHNGNVKEVGSYFNDTMTGRTQGFYENGLLKFSFNYDKGEQTDTNTLYFENGQMEQQVVIVNGLLNGMFRSWYPSGNQMKEIFYTNGILDGVYKEWHMDGTLAISGNYNQGLKDGRFESFEIFIQTPLRVETYKMGKKNGVFLEYDQEGDTAKMAHYVDDVIEGEYVEYMRGMIESKGNYINGVKDGYWQQNLVTLIGAQEGTYNMGVKVGEWVLYDFKGKWLATITFDDEGEIIDEYWYGMKKRKSKK